MVAVTFCADNLLRNANEHLLPYLELLQVKQLMLANVSTSQRPTCNGKLTGGSTEETAFSSLPKTTRLWV